MCPAPPPRTATSSPSAKRRSSRSSAQPTPRKKETYAQVQTHGENETVTLETLKAQLEETESKDLDAIDSETETARNNLASRLDGEVARLTEEANAQTANLDKQVDAEKQQLVGVATGQRVLLQSRAAQEQGVVNAQRDAELKTLDDNKLRLKHEAEDQAAKLKEKAKSDAATVKGLAEADASVVTLQATADGEKALAPARAAAAAEMEGIDDPMEKLAALSRAVAIMAPAQEQAGDLKIKGELAAKQIRATAEAEANRLINAGDDQADHIIKTQQGQDKQLAQRATDVKTQTEGFIQQSQKATEDRLAQQDTAVHGAMSPHKEAIEKRVQETTEKIAKEKEEGLKKIDADAERKRKSVLQRTQQARQQLEHGSQHNVKQLEAMVQRTCTDLDHDAEELEKTLEADIEAEDQKVGAWADSELDGIAAEAEQGLTQIDAWVKQAMAQMQMDFDAQTKGVDAVAKAGMATVELAGAEAVGDTQRSAELDTHVSPEVAKALHEQSMSAAVAAANDALDKQTADAIVKVGKSLTEQLGQLENVNQGGTDAGVEVYKENKQRAEDAAATLAKATETGFLKGADTKTILGTLKQCRTKEEADAFREAYFAKTGKKLDDVLQNEVDEHELLEAEGDLSGDPVRKASGELINSLGNRHTFIVSWNSSVDENKVHEVLKQFEPDPTLSAAENAERAKMREQVVADVERTTGMKLNHVLEQRLDKENAHEACQEADVKEYVEPQKREVSNAEVLKTPGTTNPDNIAAAQKMWAALDDFHMTGVPTGELLAQLDGKTPAEKEAIRAIFLQKSHGIPLDDVLEDKLRGDVLREAKAELSNDPVDVVVGKLREARSDGLFGGADVQKIQDTLEKIPDPATRRAAAERFERETGLSVHEMIDKKITNNGLTPNYDHDIAVSLLDDDKLGAASLRLSKAQANVNFWTGKQETNEEDVYKVFEKLDDPRDRERVAADYLARTGRHIEDDLQAHMQGAKRDAALALLDGDKGAATAARIDDAGDDFKKITAQLEGKSDKERADFTAAWNARHPDQPLDQYLGTKLQGLEAEKARALVDTGKCPVEVELGLAMGDSVWNKAGDATGADFLQTWGTDDKAVRRLLEGKSKDEIDQIKAAYKKRFNKDLDGELERHLSGRDAFDVREAMKGKPDNPAEQIQRMIEIHQFERNAGSGVADLISDSGQQMDQQYDRVLEIKRQLDEQGMDSLTAEQKKELDYLTGNQSATRTTLIESKNTVSSALAMAATAVVGTVATILSAGTLGPVFAAVAGSIIGSGAGMAVKAGIQGAAYGIKDVTQDAAMAIVSAIAAGTLKTDFIKGLAETVSGATALSPDTIKTLFQGLSAGGQAMIGAAITDKDARNLGELLSHSVGAGGIGMITGVGGGFAAAGATTALGEAEGAIEAFGKGTLSGAAGSVATTITNPETLKAMAHGDWETVLASGATQMVQGAAQGGLGGLQGFHEGALQKATAAAKEAQAAGLPLETQQERFQSALEAEQQRGPAESNHPTEPAHEAPPPSAAAIEPDRIIPVGEQTEVSVAHGQVEVNEHIVGQPVEMVGGVPEESVHTAPHAEPENHAAAAHEETVPTTHEEPKAPAPEEPKIVREEQQAAPHEEPKAPVEHDQAPPAPESEKPAPPLETEKPAPVHEPAQVVAPSEPAPEPTAPAREEPAAHEETKPAVEEPQRAAAEEPLQKPGPSVEEVHAEELSAQRDKIQETLKDALLDLPTDPADRTPEEIKKVADLEARAKTLDQVEHMSDAKAAGAALDMLRSGDPAIHEQVAQILAEGHAPGGDEAAMCKALDELHKPWDLAQQTEFQRADPAALSEARALLAEHNPNVELSPQQSEAVLDAAIGHTRERTIADGATMGLSPEDALKGQNLAGLCHVSQLETVQQLVAAGIDLSNIAMHGTDVEGSPFKGAPDHHFAVAQMPDGKVYLIDSTVTQFLPSGENGGEVGRRLFAADPATVNGLATRGFVELTPEVANAYGQALTGNPELRLTPEQYLQSSEGLNSPSAKFSNHSPEQLAAAHEALSAFPEPAPAEARPAPAPAKPEAATAAAAGENPQPQVQEQVVTNADGTQHIEHVEHVEAAHDQQLDALLDRVDIEPSHEQQVDALLNRVDVEPSHEQRLDALLERVDLPSNQSAAQEPAATTPPSAANEHGSVAADETPPASVHDLQPTAAVHEAEPVSAAAPTERPAAIQPPPLMEVSPVPSLEDPTRLIAPPTDARILLGDELNRTPGTQGLTVVNEGERPLGPGEISSKDASLIVNMRAQAETTEAGSEALRNADRSQGQLAVRQGEGSSFDPTTNSINVDPGDYDPARMAARYAHEAHHQATLPELTPAHELDAAGFASQMMRNEAESQARALEVLRQSGVSNANGEAGATAYHQAYDEAAQEFRNTNPLATDAEVAAHAMQAGTQALTPAFGQMTPSTSIATTPDGSYQVDENGRYVIRPGAPATYDELYRGWHEQNFSQGANPAAPPPEFAPAPAAQAPEGAQHVEQLEENPQHPTDALFDLVDSKPSPEVEEPQHPADALFDLVDSKPSPEQTAQSVTPEPEPEPQPEPTLVMENGPQTEQPGADEPGSPDHKAARWDEYQARTPPEKRWSYERWSNVYEANMDRATQAHAAVNAYHAEIGWGQREVTVDVEGEARRLDIADPGTSFGIEHKTGTQYATQSNLWEIARDEILVREMDWNITWVFEGAASQPLLDALTRAGIKYILR